MPVLRQRRTANFTPLPNDLLQDSRLSFRDRGLLVWMLSKPQDWRFSFASILQENPLDGKSSLQTGVKNLQKTGYLHIHQARKKGKLGDAIWTVTDAPYPENKDTVTDAPYPRKPHPENRDYTNNRNNKKKSAVPAVEGGVQLAEGFYLDPVSDEWRRKENT